MQSLLNEHQEIMARLRHISGKVLNIVDDKLVHENNIDTQKLNIKDKEALDAFLKISSLLLKLLPAELQINGTDLKHDKATLSAENNKEITQDEIRILKNYLKRCRRAK